MTMRDTCSSHPRGPLLGEHGRERDATQARLVDTQQLLLVEGGRIDVGRDGSTWCLLSDDLTLSEFDLGADGPSGGRQLLRFGSRADLDAYVSQQSWAEWLPRTARLVAATGEPGLSRPKPTSLEFDLFAGMTDSHAHLSIARGTATYQWSSSESSAVEIAVSPGPDEFARLAYELKAAGVGRWQPYGRQALDGLEWSIKIADPLRVEAEGHNAYPPDGGPNPSPEFLRVRLAIDRLLGREVWPGWRIEDALAAVRDPAQRLEERLLAAARMWAGELEVTSTDPDSLRESHMEAGLRECLNELGDCQTQQAPGLANWSPGNVDLVLEEADARGWVELKWCKTAETFGNTLWDAAKCAAAFREGVATQAWLLVGAPTSIWEAPPGEAVVTGVSWHAGSSLVDDFPTWWALWQRENTRTFPRRLPTPVVTLPAGRVRIHSPQGRPWELRLVRVHAPGDESYVPLPGA